MRLEPRRYYEMPLCKAPVYDLDDLPGLPYVVHSEARDATAREAASARLSDRPSLGYKYFMSLEGTVHADYPTMSWADHSVRELWSGDAGELRFGRATGDDVFDCVQVVDALRSLPVHEVTETLRTRGSMVLRHDRCRRLR